MPQSEIQKHIEALKDSDPEVCKRAAEALGKIGDPAAVPALIETMHTKSSEVGPEVGLAAAKALRNLGPEGLTVYAQLLDVYSSMLQDGDITTRWSGILALGEIGDPAAVPALIKALKDEYSAVRSNAVGSLGKIGDPAAVPALIKALKDKDPFVRQGVPSSLSDIGDPAAVPALIKAVKDKDPTVRSNAVGSLGKIGDPAAVPALIKAVKDKDEEVRKAAAHALKKLQGND